MVPSIKELRKICQSEDHRTNQRRKWRGRLNNNISIYFTWLLLHTPIIGNQVTFLMLIFAIISAIFFAKGQYIYSLVGILFFQLYVLFDWSDGEVARYRKIFSKKGAYLDYITHVIVNPIIFLGISLGAYFNNPLPIPNYIYLIAGGLAAYSFMINQFARLKKYEMYIDQKETKNLFELRQRMKKTPEHKVKEFLHDFFRMNTLNAIVIFGILNLIPYLVLIYGVILPIMAFARVYAEFKMIKD